MPQRMTDSTLTDAAIAIHQLRLQLGYMPTLHEIAKKLDISLGAAQNRVNRLASLGYLNAKGDSTARSLYFTKTIEYQGQTIPVLGVCN